MCIRDRSYGGRPADRAKELKNLLWWMTHDGQKFNEELEYGKLPAKTLKIVEDIINSMTYKGQPIK
ncbi:MAG: hypothetical protein N2258_04745, partial [Brevinematales bacterium]|nr:hypothetical protein [Brevinematales bacterium]